MVSGNTESLNYAGNDGTCNHSWLTKLLGNVPMDEADQCGVVCKLQELDRGVFSDAVVGVEGEEQWGENAALRSSSADGTGAGCEFTKLY